MEAIASRLEEAIASSPRSHWAYRDALRDASPSRIATDRDLRLRDLRGGGLLLLALPALAAVGADVGTLDASETARKGR